MPGEEVFALRGDCESLFALPDGALPEHFVAHGDRQHPTEVVVAGSGKAQFGHGRWFRVLSQRAQRLHRGGDIAVLQTKKPLPAIPFRNNQATRKKLCEMRTCGLGRDCRRHGQLRGGMAVAIQQGGEHLDTSCFAHEAGNARD